MKAKACWVWIDGRWWPGYLEQWRRTEHGWYGWCWAEWHEGQRWFHENYLRSRHPGERAPRDKP